MPLRWRLQSITISCAQQPSHTHTHTHTHTHAELTTEYSISFFFFNETTVQKGVLCFRARVFLSFNEFRTGRE